MNHRARLNTGSVGDTKAGSEFSSLFTLTASNGLGRPKRFSNALAPKTSPPLENPVLTTQKAIILFPDSKLEGKVSKRSRKKGGAAEGRPPRSGNSGDEQGAQAMNRACHAARTAGARRVLKIIPANRRLLNVYDQLACRAENCDCLAAWSRPMLRSSSMREGRQNSKSPMMPNHNAAEPDNFYSIIYSFRLRPLPYKQASRKLMPTSRAQTHEKQNAPYQHTRRA